MKKKLIIAAVALLAIGGIALAIIASNANKLVAGYKPELERIASNALSAKVSIAELDVSVFPSARIVAKQFRIAPPKGGGSGVTLEELTVSVPLFPLLAGKVTVQKLLLERPQLTFLKTKKGIVIDGLQQLGQSSNAAAQRPPSGGVKKKKKGAAQPPALPEWFHFELSEFRIREARISVKEPGKSDTLTLEPIQVTSDLKLDGSQAHIHQLSFDTRVNQVLPLRAQGKDLELNLKSLDIAIGSLDIFIAESSLTATGKANLKNLSSDLKLTSEGFDLEPIEKLALRMKPDLPMTDLSGMVTPELAVKSSGTRKFNAQGGVSLSGISLASNEVVISELSGPLKIDANEVTQKAFTDAVKMKIGEEPVKATFAFNNSSRELTFDKFHIEGFGGTVNSSGKLIHAEKEKPFRKKVTISSVDLGRLLNAVKPSLAGLLSGTLDSFNLGVEGELGAKDPVQSFRGSGTVLVKEGELKQINLAREVLGAVKGLPFLTGSLEDSVPEEEREDLEENKTTIHALTGAFTIGEKTISLSQLSLESSVFDLEATGTIGFDTDLNLKAKLVFSKSFSSQLVRATKELKNLLNRDERLVIPLQLTGKLPEVTVLPDTSELLTLAAGKALEKKAGKLLDKLVGDDSGSAGKALGDILGF